MLVKLAFVMQRLKKYLKEFFHDQQRWGGGAIFRFYRGDTAVMRGDIELMGGPPTWENPADWWWMILKTSPKGEKDWVQVQFTAFNPCVLQKIDLIMVLWVLLYVDFKLKS